MSEELTQSVVSDIVARYRQAEPEVNRLRAESSDWHETLRSMVILLTELAATDEATQSVFTAEMEALMDITAYCYWRGYNRHKREAAMPIMVNAPEKATGWLTRLLQWGR